MKSKILKRLCFKNSSIYLKSTIAKIVFAFLCFALPLSYSCNQKNHITSPVLLLQQNFDSLIDGKKVELFTLRNSSGCVAQVMNFGARWISMWVPDKNGKLTDVVLGFNKLRDYIAAGEPYHGAIVGRNCGRINKGKFSLEGKEFILSNNDLFGKPVKNNLHGGIKGFNKQMWDGKLFKNENGEEGVSLNYFSKDGEEGFPGNLTVEVKYLLTNNNELIIIYKASTDKTTIVNLTNHAYFNLNGEGSGNILDHQMKVYAEKYVECDSELIPTGKLKPVEGTPLDYRDFAQMGKGINQDHDQIIKGKGYAAAMVIKENNSEIQKTMAEAYSNESGISIKVISDKPSLQLYNAWLFNGKDIGKSGKAYEFSGGFVMEPQGFPDATNHPDFPQITLHPDGLYYHKDIYRFSLVKTINK